MTSKLFRTTCLAIGLGIAAPAQAVEVWVTQTQYLRMTDDQQRMFVSGVADSYSALLDGGVIAPGDDVDGDHLQPEPVQIGLHPEPGGQARRHPSRPSRKSSPISW